MEALSDTPVVLLNGARQTGKSTLVQHLAKTAHPANYLTFDDVSVLSAAKNDPLGFLHGFDGPVILDEVQRAPELFLAIKNEVDRNRQPGRFFLTGSANVMLLPKLSESLAGRMEIHTLWPLSQSEIEVREKSFIDAEFSHSAVYVHPVIDRAQLIDRILRGGYPEVLERKIGARRNAWYNAYLTTIIQRDVRDISNIEDLTALPRLLSLLATRIASLVNYADISRSIGIPQSTLKRYTSLLETTFLVLPLRAWSSNLGQRLIKAPKLVMNDTGLLTYLLAYTKERFARQPDWLGPILENFVIMELRKQMTWSETRTQIFHFRTVSGIEVDILLEDAEGRCIGIEVKATEKVVHADFKGLRFLSESLGSRFVSGTVLYLGRNSIPFGQNMWALPLGALWRAHG